VATRGRQGQRQGRQTPPSGGGPKAVSWLERFRLWQVRWGSAVLFLVGLLGLGGIFGGIKYVVGLEIGIQESRKAVKQLEAVEGRLDKIEDDLEAAGRRVDDLRKSEVLVIKTLLTFFEERKGVVSDEVLSRYRTQLLLIQCEQEGKEPDLVNFTCSAAPETLAGVPSP